MTYNYEIVEISDLDPGASELLRQEEGTSYTSSITPRIVWDSRDNQFDPAGGSVQAFEVTGAGLGGTNRFYKVVGSTTWYFPLPEGLTGFVRGRFGIGDGYAGKELPAWQSGFFSEAQRPYVALNFVTLAPKIHAATLWGAPRSCSSTWRLDAVSVAFLRLVTFFDAGNVYNPGNQFDFGDLRRSAGVGFRLITPLGPIRLDYGFKLDRRRGESMGAIGFLLGTF